MKVFVNGEPKELPDGMKLLALLDSLGMPRERLAVEVNQDIVTRARHAEHHLAEGDRIEIVQFVGGG